MRASIARADDHVEPEVEFLEQAGEFGRVVLPVAVHEADDFAARCPRARLDRGAVAEAFGVAYDLGPR